MDFQKDIAEKIIQGRYQGKRHFIIVVAEGVGHCNELAQRIKEETGIETRVSILGHIQRGGSPTARDRVMASRMGHMAVEELVKGKTNEVIVYLDSQLKAIPMEEAMKMHKKLDPYMYQVAYDISL